MRIAHVSSYYLPRLGGIEMQVADLAARQAAAGHEVSVITSTHGDPDLHAGRVTVQRVAHGRPHRLPVHVRAPGAGVRALLDGDFDVVHAHTGGWSPLAIAGAWTAPAHGIPTVVTLHSILSREIPLFRAMDHVTGWRRRRVAWTAVSEAAAAPLRDLLLPGTAVSALPNGVDVSAWRVKPEPRDSDDVVAVAVMRLAARKRPLPLLRILRTAREGMSPRVRFRAVIVGEGPQRARMDRYVRQHGMSGYVELRGRQTREEIRALYANADMFVAPAHLESFGIAALEARCAGLPVVAMAAGGVSDVIHDGQEGLLVDTDQQLAGAIVRLSGSSGMRLRMSRHNQVMAPPFDWPETLQRAHREYARAAELLGHPLRSEPGLPDVDRPRLPSRAARSA